jgi:hypothetical protein
MKKALSLLAVTMLTASGTGCNCCPCLRNICPFGGCGSLCRPADTCPPAPMATYAAVPASPCGPGPVYAAAPMATPVFAATPQQYTVPQYAAPQYAAPMSMPAQPVYSEAGCGASYAQEAPCCSGMQYTVADPGCGIPMSAPCGCDVGYGTPVEGQVMPSPAP